MRQGESRSAGVAKVANLLLVVLLLVGIAVMFVLRRERASGAPEAAAHPAAPPTAPAAVSEPDLEAVGTVLEEASSKKDWSALIKAGTDAAARGRDAARVFVLQLFAALDRMSPADRLAVVVAFLESGRDVRFGGAFTVGTGGYLKEWPTLRVALLDYLSQRDSVAARMLAEELLETRPAEPGEWTVAFRELVRGSKLEELPPRVVERLHQFVADREWIEQAPRSWLEGFDILVAAGSREFLPDLSAVAEATGSSRGAQFAAFLAADRLTMASPAEALDALNNDLSLFATQPVVRAGLFARADVRDAAQLHVLEAYFLRADVSPAERASFADFFPLYDLAVSQNLLTRPASRSIGNMIAHDRVAIAHIDRWLADVRFAHWHSSLRQVRELVSQQLSQAGP